jgi:hypothetical protein
MLSTGRNDRMPAYQFPRYMLLAILFTVAVDTDARAVAWIYPSVTHGVWFADNSDGREQYRAYKRIDKANADAVSTRLAGATIISPRLIHEYADYGEGGFS